MTVTQLPFKKVSAFLAQFRYGNPERIVAYTDWTVDLTHANVTYLSTPRMAIKPIVDSGLMDDEPVVISLPLDTFTDAISSGEPHAPIFVELRERVESDDDSLVSVRFLGRVDIAYRNYQRVANTVALECRSWKYYLQSLSGITVDHQCPWTVYDPRTCKTTKTGKTGVGVITAISDTAVTISGLTTKPDFFWNRGFLELDGLRLMIRYWASGTTFLLNRRPPSAWAGQAVTVTAGCDNLVETCRTTHSNESNFGGAGYGMTPYNPVFETE